MAVVIGRAGYSIAFAVAAAFRLIAMTVIPVRGERRTGEVTPQDTARSKDGTAVPDRAATHNTGAAAVR
ncbi:hypothetical protein [Yinghuangia seranimata]|uniref:hypothetical protein n=1 Tax=Yinghuangia seranimata TaxID=408067 RepID=UPI00248CA1C7|nr:hypothetical protein [Yinghuangia seranimata]MDI2124896.1 hypothetical protein [Yinghuangia seranimata]